MEAFFNVSYAARICDAGKISFQNPELNPATRINLIRISVPNKDNELKPGMSAYITVKTSGANALFLPSDAVLRDGKMAMIWIETSQNRFKSVMVKTGMESGNMIEIKSGIEPNDVVVTSGAYLLQSEYVFNVSSIERCQNYRQSCKELELSVSK
jgi:membrane fusion protein, copper/silver efflux system